MYNNIFKDPVNCSNKSSFGNLDSIINVEKYQEVLLVFNFNGKTRGFLDHGCRT